MGEFLKQLQSVSPLVTQAPWAFAALAAVIFFAGWAAGRFMFGERIETLKARLEAYKEKLDGASPDQVARKIAALERRTTIVPYEELQHLPDKEAIDRQVEIRRLVEQYEEAHAEPPSEDWINNQLAAQGRRWRARYMDGEYYLTYEPG
jgi:hypothetical protein